MRRSDLDQSNTIGTTIVGSAIRVHRELGPGLLETAYQACLCWELRHAELSIETEVKLPITYRSCSIDAGYRVDILIERAVIIENKAVERLLPVHTAQLLTYLQLSGLWLGYLLNWNVKLMKHGINRFVVGGVGAGP